MRLSGTRGDAERPTLGRFKEWKIWIILMITSGYFAIGYCVNGKILRHKALHNYNRPKKCPPRRVKENKIHPLNDKFSKGVSEILFSWKKEIDSADVMWIHALGDTRRLIYCSKNNKKRKAQHKICGADLKR